ncbi:hypothetical protein pb186bvf_013015 [Paramecium bursaria]
MIDESSIIHDEMLIQRFIQELTVTMINQLRLELKPTKLMVESLRNLVCLFQGTEDWIELQNSTWSRLNQFLRNPKKLQQLIKNHKQLDLYQNIHQIDYTIFEQQNFDETSMVLCKIVCGLVQYHSNLQEISLFSEDSNTLRHFILNYEVPQVSLKDEYLDDFINTHSKRAREILSILKHQASNTKPGEYRKCFF